MSTSIAFFFALVHFRSEKVNWNWINFFLSTTGRQSRRWRGTSVSWSPNLIRYSTFGLVDRYGFMGQYWYEQFHANVKNQSFFPILITGQMTMLLNVFKRLLWSCIISTDRYENRGDWKAERLIVGFDCRPAQRHLAEWLTLLTSFSLWGRIWSLKEELLNSSTAFLRKLWMSEML